MSNQINPDHNESDYNQNQNYKQNQNKHNKKQNYIDTYIHKLMIPYILYLNIVLSDDNVYKKLKKHDKNNGINKTNLYFLMEIIKKNIENLDE